MKRPTEAPTMSTTDAAELLGISPGLVRRYCRQGRLGSRHGRDYRITAEQLAEFAKLDRPRGKPHR
jgi:excisionase family DNA binding protein